MATDPEALYTEVLQEEQQKGVSAPVAEGRAKAARARAEQGSPHPKEPKWWPGAQPHLEGGNGAAPAEEVAEEPVAEEAPAAEAPAAEAPAEAPAAGAPGEGAPESAPEPPSQPEPQPAAVTAPQPAAAAAPAPTATATATELAPGSRPSGVSHGTAAGNRLRPEDSVGTDAQFDGQQAVYRRRKMIDELVATGVPAVTATEAGRPRGTSPASVLIYLVILVVAAAFLVSQKDALSSGAPTEEVHENGGGGGGGLSISASGTQFDTDQLTLPAEETELEFVNEDSVQHNVSIYEDDSASADLFLGDVIPGGQSITYTIPALEPGEFYFQCDVHPSMNGTVTVE